MSVAPVQYHGGSIGVGGECVAFEIAGHLRPVDAAHVFAPAEDLAHKALDTGERRMTRLKSCHGRRDHLARVQEFQVERCREV